MQGFGHPARWWGHPPAAAAAAHSSPACDLFACRQLTLEVELGMAGTAADAGGPPASELSRLVQNDSAALLAQCTQVQLGVLIRLPFIQPHY